MVAGINALYPMENQCCATFKLMLRDNYTVYFNLANSYTKTIKIPCIVVSESHLLAVIFMVNTAENKAIWLVTIAQCVISS